jgi:alkylated DNA repair protein alkB family protein 6
VATSVPARAPASAPSTPRVAEFPPLSCGLELSRACENLEQWRVGSLPDVFYVPDAVSPAVERELLAQARCGAAKWTALKSRRLQCYGAPEHGAMPPWLEWLADALVQSGVFERVARPNHALLNEYQPGQGVLAHTDGPCYLPRVACVSLGSVAVISFVERLAPHEIGDRPAAQLARLLLRPRSLLVFGGDAYDRALHEVPATALDLLDGSEDNLELAGAHRGDVLPRETRLSITMRTWRA